MTLCLTLRVVDGLPLRQTQGLMRSVAALMDKEMSIPDFSTLSPGFWPMAPMMVRQPVICRQHALAKARMSLSRHRRTPLPARNRRWRHRQETATSPR